MEFAVTAEENDVRVGFEQILERGKSAIVGHFQFDQPLRNPRRERLLHLRLLFFDVQARHLRSFFPGLDHIFEINVFCQ